MPQSLPAAEPAMYEDSFMQDHDDALLALLLDDGLAAGTGTLEAHTSATVAPLSYSQQRLWFLQTYEPDLTAYNLPSAFRLYGTVDGEALQIAFAALVERHGVLRSRFFEQDGQPCQEVLPQASFRLEQVDLGNLPAAERENELARLLRENAAHRFDLSQPPLIRASLVRLGAQEHVLLICLHHIVSDAWSNPLLVRDLAQAYLQARTQGKASLAPLPSQYADFARWQRTQQGRERMAADLDYWRGHVGAAPAALDLPLDRPRPPNQTFNGARVSWDFDPALTAAVQAFCKAHRFTPFVPLLAAWQVLLARYSGQQSFAVGVPHAGRSLPEVQDLVGFFVNTQVYPVRLADADTYTGLCRRLRDEAVAALDHAALPFEMLLETLKVRRDNSRSPVFQTLFNLRMAARSLTLDLDGLQVHPIADQHVTAKFDVMLDVVIEGGRARAALEYNTDLFDEATIQRLRGHYAHLLQFMLRQPDAPVMQAELMGDDERARLHAWGHAPRDLGQPVAVHRLIEARVAAQPHAPALQFGTSTLTYAEMNARANRLARQLRECGVGPDVKVGVAAERSLELVLSLLAIMKAGGAYVPLDPDYPADRVAFMLADSGVSLLLAQPRLRPRLPAHACAVIDIDESVGMAADACADDLEDIPGLPLHGEHLAYVIYTSGSTGRPKGVGNRHCALYNRLAWMQAEYGLDERDAVLQKTPYSFDVSVWEFFWPLMTGARLVVAGPGDHRDPVRLAALIAGHGITTLHFVPSMLQAFVAHAALAGEAGRCPSLKRIICSGEALPGELQDRALAQWPWAGLHNLYGPTEAAIDVTYWQCSPTGGAAVPIGRPIANVQTHVLDGRLEPVPVGVAGELYLGGIGLARGYLGRAALTAERFVPDPRGTGGRLYRTGDVCRWRADGALEYLGRTDHQVKIRGLRIELGEIEAALTAQPGVSQSVVVAHHDAQGARLVGYVVGGTDTRVDAQALRAALGSSLPEYMVPQTIVVLAEMPLSPNGKIDRKALPAPEFSASARFEAPRGEGEILLAGIWREVLGVAQVGRDDNFFELGGDSILSLQIVARARKAGMQLSARQLFEHQTIAGLAEVAQALAERAPHAPQRAGGAQPLLPIQARFFQGDVPRRHHWNQAVLLHADAALDADALRQALDAVLATHDALRLRYREGVDGEWSQAYAEHADAADAVLWQRRVRGEAALQQVCVEAQRSLDLAAGPLLRAVAIDADDAGWRLLLVVHHLVVDGVSWRVLLEDLASAYRQAALGQPPALPPASASYQEWARQLQQHAHDDAVRAELPYWQAQESVRATLPGQVGGGGLQANQARCTVTLSMQETRQLLKEVPAAYRTQVNDVLLTALGRALCEWTGSSEILVDIEGHGREPLADDMDLSRSVGWFTTIYPVRLAPTGTPGDALKRVKESVRSVPGRGLGHGLLRYLGAAGDRLAMATLPQPEVQFNYLGQFDNSFGADAPWRLAQEGAGATRDAGAPLSHALAVTGQVHEGRLALTAFYDGARFEAPRIERVLARTAEELRALIRHCLGAQGFTPSDFPLAALTQAQLDALPLSARQVEDLYPLAPMQAGMLFHSLYDDTRQGRVPSYVNQLCVDVTGLDVKRFVSAWRAAMARHDVLRTGFLAQPGGAGEPLQWVARAPELPLRELDWRSEASAPDLQARLDALAGEERTRGFTLAEPPLMRLVLVRVDAERYRVIWTVHHLLLDGWSTSRLLGEVLREYGGVRPAARRGRFRDYLAWLAGRDTRASERYWRELLAPAGSGTHLAGAVAAPRTPIAGHAEHARQLDHASFEALAQAARCLRVTLNTLVQAAWLLILQRYTGQDAVVCGVTVAGRPQELPGAHDMLGLFINTLPVLGMPSETMTAGDWLREVQSQNLASREHEHTPLYEIQRWTGAAGRGLFDTLLVYENYPVDGTLREAAPGGLAIDAPALREQTHYPLTLAVVQQEGLRLRLGYDREVYGEDVVEALGRHLVHAMTQLAQAPQQRLAALVLPDAQETALLQRWGGADPRHTEGPLVHQMIAAHAALRPDAAAAALGDEVWTHARVHAESNRLAGVLRARGVGRESRVAVAMGRSPRALTAYLAVLKAGGAYVPLDPGYPAQRLADIVQDSGACLLLTEPALREAVAHACGTGPAIWTWDEAELARQSAEFEPAALHAASLAYVIYTSGSTGKPKGVAVPHGPLAMHVRATIDGYEMGAHTRELHFLSFAFDGAHERWLSALAAGGMVQLRDDELWSAQRTWQALHDYRITNAGFPPVYLKQLAEWAEEAGDPPPVDLYSFGGEAMPQATLAQVVRALQPRLLINGYGPTETVVTPLTWKAYAETAAAQLRTPYAPICGGDAPGGGPVGERVARVLDDALNPVPIGVTGGLYLGGAGLARGYLDRPGQTAAAFLPDPYGPPGARLYRTGDLVRWTRDGALEYLGRIDHQVKIRGFRIELGEIEARLLAHDDVAQAVVVAHRDGTGARLAAYVAPHAGCDPQSQALKDMLRALLPDYMVPASLTVMPALPLNVSGKIDRRALPAPSFESEREYEVPQGALETALAGVWREVLGVARVGRHDNLFELGGDSILTLQIVARARRAGLQLAPRQLFEHQTVAELARVAQLAGAQAVAVAGTERAEGPAALTPIQASFFDQDLPQRHHWNQSLLLTPSETLDGDVLEQALQALAAHHDAFRLRFVRDVADGAWKQVYQAEAPAVPLHREALDGAESLDAVCRRCQASLDLRRPPLAQAWLVQLPQDEQRLLFVAHHLIVDGVSWRVLLEDLQTAYRQLQSGACVSLPPRTSSLAAWTDRLAQQARSPELLSELPYWQAQREAAAIALPLDNARAANTQAQARHERIELDAQATAKLLHEAPAAYRTQISDLLLAALAGAVAHWTGRDTVGINLEGHGREPWFPEIDLHRTVGWFTSVYPVALPVHDGPEETLKAVKEALRAVPRKGLGYGVLKYLGDGEARQALAGTAAPITFNYLGQLDAGAPADALLRLADEPLGGGLAPDTPLGEALAFNARVSGGRLRIDCRYGGAQLRADTVAALLADMHARLRALIALCEGGQVKGVTPSDVPLAGLDQARLDALLRRLAVPAAQLEDLYPATPIQQGMLHDALLKPRSVANIVQMQARVADFDAPRFIAAWRAAVARHPVLRTAIVWQGDLPEPLQLVLRTLEFPADVRDWTGRSDVDADWQALCDHEYGRGFDLERAPLMRLVLVQVGQPQARDYRYVWTWHHLLLDGWSMSTLLGEVLREYAGEALPAACGPVASHREYLAWLRGHDPHDDRAFWRERVAPLARPTLLAPTLPRPGCQAAEHYGLVQRRLDPVQVERLQRHAASQQVTVNTVVQAAWLLVLQRRLREQVLAFGATVAGRSGDLPGLDNLTGLSINTLPVVQRLQPGQRVGEWLRDLQRHNLELRQREHVALYDVQRWAGRSGRPLFDTLMLFENYPVDSALKRGSRQTVRFSNVVNRGATRYPITVVILPTNGLTLRLEYDRAEIAADAVPPLMDEFEALLLRLGQDAGRTVAEAAEIGVPIYAPVAASASPALSAGPAVEPPAAVSNALLGLWREVLALDDAQPAEQDDFFDLGGTSIDAVRLLARCRELAAQGVLPAAPALADLYAHRTARDLAGRLAELARQPAPGIVRLAGQADAQPACYGVPARLGNPDEYRAMAQGLSLGRPVVGLHSPPELEEQWAALMLPDLAARYADLLLSQDRGQPFCLVGWSIGGLLSLEIARQLQGRADLRLAAMLDVSDFTRLRTRLAALQAPPDALLARLEAELHGWLARSAMASRWHALLGAFSPPQYWHFLLEVVGRHTGEGGPGLPLDGPQPASREYALWSELNCLRLALGYAMPDAPVAVDVCAWQSEASANGGVGQPDWPAHARLAGRLATIAGTDHLNLLASPAMHRALQDALSHALRRQGTPTC